MALRVGVYAVRIHWLLLNLLFAVGEFRPGDSVIEISGLVPTRCYSIRICVMNLSGHISSAPIIRIQTGLLPCLDSKIDSSCDEIEPAILRTTSSRLESLDVQNNSKEVVGSQAHPSKGPASRKPHSPAVTTGEQVYGMSQQYDGSTDEDSPDQLDQLVEKLEALKKQKEDIDKQIEEEDNEVGLQVTELSEERDRLKQSYKDREEASAELRRQGNQLDKANRSAQSRRAAKEKQLQQKKAERKRIVEDTVRREKEIQETRAQIEELRSERLRVEAEKDQFVEEKQRAILDDQSAIRDLEEEIHSKGAQIKTLEQKRDELSSGEKDDQQSRDTVKEADDRWESRLRAMESQLTNWRHAVQQASMEEQQARDHLSWWLEKRVRNPEHFAPIASWEPSAFSHNRSRRSRHSNSRASTISSNIPNAPLSMSNEPGMRQSYPSTTPFFSMGNGTAVAPGNEHLEVSQAEADLLTGGAAMSPAANELLPSNLFRDEDVNGHLPTTMREGNVPASRDPFTRHAVTNSDLSMRGPHTPVSAGSRTGSMLPSPRDSLQNIATHRSRSDTFDENDHPSIASTSSAMHPPLTAEGNPLASNRFANLFSSPFNRQRGKSNTQEPPMLGALKQGQSQSFPRNLEQDEIDNAGPRRRRGSHSYWANPMAGLLTRNAGQVEPDQVLTPRTSSGRKSRLPMFGSKYNDLDPTPFSDQLSSSRPSSTYSQDQVFARPSSESSQARWHAMDVPNRNSPLGAKWAPSSGLWQHVPSRRPSVQHGSSTNLSLGSTPLEPDEFSGPLKKQKSDQAPIGTRPLSSQRPVTPRLNPAAPTFKTLFSRGEAKKAMKQEKSSAKTSERFKEKDAEKGDTEDVEGTGVDSSPNNPRLSRDAQSITTAASTADSHESFERSTSGTPSEAVTPSSGLKEPKESLMQKITRKSSSSKFNVPWSKDRGGFFSSKRAGEPSTPGDVDEDNTSESQMGKSLESAGSTPQQEKPGRTSLTWSNMRRKSRKGEGVDKSSEAGEDDE